MKRQGSETVPGGPGDGHHALLERHPQRLQRVAAELAELVEEEDAAMGPRHLARSRRRAAPDQRPRRDGVMRRPERAPQPRSAVLAAGAGDPGHLDHLVAAQRRQQRGQPLQRERLALRRAGRSAAGCGRPRRRSPGSGAAPGDRAGPRGPGRSSSGSSGGAAGGTGSIVPSASSRSRVTWSTGITSSPPTSAAWAASPGRDGDATHAPSAWRPPPSPGRPAPAGSRRRGRARRRARIDRAPPAAAARRRPGARRRSRDRIPARPCAGRPGARLAVIRCCG